MDKESRTFLHVLERKLNNLRKRIPLYCHCMVLFDESIICITLPGIIDDTIRMPVDYASAVEANVKKVHDILRPYFPVLRYNGKDYYIDKVDFRSNSFVVKALWKDERWASIYQMRQPVSFLLKEFQSDEMTSEDKGVLFCQSIRNNKSEEDFRVF